MFIKLSQQLFGFAIIGGVGFIVDGGVLTYLSTKLGMNIYLSRLTSFGLASFTTWMLNRKYTFRRQSERSGVSRGREYCRYILIQTSGALINLGIFALIIMISPVLKSIPVIPLAIGAGIALVFNFVGLRIWVFQK